MISLEAAISFFIINVTLCLIPCAEMVITVTQSTVQGWKAGIAFIMGYCSAFAGQVVLMAFGVSAIFQTSTVAFSILKVVGVCYLFYLAWQAFTQPIIVEKSRPLSALNRKGLFRKGVIINFSNPMAPFYLLLIIPPFIPAESDTVVLQSLQLGFLVIAAFLCMYTLYSLAAHKIGDALLQSDRNRRFFQRSAALTIAGFAVYLAIAQQS